MKKRSADVLDLLAAFLSAEATGAALLVLASGAALVWANSPVAASYEEVWGKHLALTFGARTVIDLDLRHWVNDALMALFFFVVGLEIKREVADGELRTARRALLPAAAALGGMVAPAAIFLVFNAGQDTARAWAVPMATDIAFAVGVLSIFGSRVPRGLTAFLLALAIADDIGSIAVIAFFYGGPVDAFALAVAAVALAGVVLLWRVPHVWTDPPLVVLMVVVWAATLASGVHATVAGVALGLLAPATPQPPKLPVAQRLELTLHPWTTYLVVPLFAVANAGVRVDATAVASALSMPVGMGIVLGLVVGKPAGIIAASWGAVRSGLGALPAGTRWRDLAAASAVAGIGFTVSFFIAQLALDGAGLDAAKVAVLVGSSVSAAVGILALWRGLPRARR